MSPIVRPAGEADIDAVVELLHTRMNPKIPRARWRRILDYPWRPPDVERGWLVEAEGEVVGFMATIYSDRPTPLGIRRFCDLGSWYLLREHRGSGVGDALLRAGMARPEVTYATMTARAATGRKIRALGFQVLDDTRSLFEPRPGAAPELTVEPATPQALATIGPEALRIVADHEGLPVSHAILREGDKAVHLAYHVKLKGEDIAYCEVLHVGDPDFLAPRAQALADRLARPERGVLAVDARFMQGAVDKGRIEALPLARWFRSPDVDPIAVDHLYSEIVLLDLKLP